MLFILVTSAMTLAIAALLGVALLRGRMGADHPAAYDLQVYRDQLRDVDRDAARGVIGAADAERLRTEVSRKVLAADAQLQKAADRTGPTGGKGFLAAALVGLAILGGAAGLYMAQGAPGYDDMPLSARLAASREALENLPDQATLVAERDAAGLPLPPALDEDYVALVEALRKAVADNPDDLRGLTLLVRSEANLGNNRAAYEAQDRVIAVKGDAAQAGDFALLADLMISAARGRVSAQADAALRAALSRDPEHPTSRYYLGLLYAQVDRPDAAFRVWETLLGDSPPDAPWVPLLRERLPTAASLAGIRYTLPDAAPLPGPDAEAVAAARDMSPEARAEMIRTMVDGLSNRLATEGGTPAEWARLIGALGVLGDLDQARAIRDEALMRFAANDDALALIRSAAARARLDE